MSALVSLRRAGAAPYAGAELLRDLELELGRGEILGVLGPNGAGKSSLLKLLCGAIPLSQGHYLFGGRPLAELTIAERARSQALLPQRSTLSFPFTVEQVAMLGRTPHASGLQTDRRVVTECLLATDTARLRQRLYTRLSGGEQQRVQLARVLAQIWRAEDAGQRLLLLDEPTAALDLSHQRRIMDILHRLAGDGCGVVMVLHDFNLAARHCHRCLLLDGGRQRALGPPAEVFTPALLREVFGAEVAVGAHPADAGPVVLPL